MPLPATSVTWPPESTRPARKLFDEWGAWYSGDAERLSRVYADAPSLDPMGPGGELPEGQPRGGARFLAALASGAFRRFWGNIAAPGQVRSHKVHFPLAGDIAITGAALLYGEPPTFTIPTDGGNGGSTKGQARDGVRVVSPTQKALDDINEEANLHAVLLESAEIGCAYGGSYLRATWDPAVAEVPLYDCIPPDAAVPEWRSGRLAAVTFYRELDSPDGKTWWHLERHEKGAVLHGLYRSGEPDKLGQRMPLDAHDATAPFALLVDARDTDRIETGASGLAVEYVPNMRPNRLLRGSPLGRSDYDGCIPLFDSLDESATSLMRDLRLGKGRIVVPRTYLQSQGRGRGATFDVEREVYELVDSLGGGKEGGLALQVVQFAIRVEEHTRVMRELTNKAIASAGYSPQTFGESDQVAATATEVTAREGASYRTRSRKITYARGPLARLNRTALEIYLAKFRPDAGIVADLPIVKWPDGVSVDPESQARTLSLLQAAEAASIYTRVKNLNPDWQPEEIEREVVRIKKDQQDAASAGAPVAEPGSTATGHAANAPQDGKAPDGIATPSGDAGSANTAK